MLVRMIGSAPVLALCTAIGAMAQPAATADGSYAIISAGGNTVAAEDLADNGMVVGRIGAKGFTLRNGVFTEYVAAPVQGLNSAFSQIYGVNNSGQFVGEYFALGVPPTGFVDTRGQLTTIAFPDANAVRTTPRDINNSGHVAGFYLTSDNKTVGFLLQGSTYHKIEIPGALFVTVLGLNDADVLVGHFTLEGDVLGTRRGFLWSNGQLTLIDYPGVNYAAGERTQLFGIGRDGTIVGSVVKSVNGHTKETAFVLRNGQFRTIGIPGVTSNAATGINTRGEICGYYEAIEVRFLPSNQYEFVSLTGVGWVLRP
jgi:uncharacterized membrane protein